MKKAIEELNDEIERYKRINELLLKADIPCFTEIDTNRGFISGLQYAVQLIEKYSKEK